MSNLPDDYPQAVGLEPGWSPVMVTREEAITQEVVRLRDEVAYLREMLRLALAQNTDSIPKGRE